MDLKAHLKDLCTVAAPSGHEGPIRAVIRNAWADLVDEFQIDGLGSLIAVKYGTQQPQDTPRRRVMLCAHMDEIGMIVSEIRDGFIRTSALGGVDYRVLLAQSVLVHGRRTLPGVVGAAPPHMALNRREYPTSDELWIDVGLPADEVAALVRIGDVITFDAPFFELKGSRVGSKSMDNRASVAAVTCCLDALARRTHEWDVYAVASAQEETAGSGAQTAAYQIQPDLAIVIDGTFALQRGVDDDEGFKLGDGPTIGRGPNFHPGLFKKMQKVAREEEIDLTVEVLPGHSGTDAWTIQLTRAGVPSTLLSVPMRNMHSPVEIVDLRDIRRIGRLMTAVITQLD
ncbi:MAG: M42 family peptidase, partial [Anaerolineae bacterium]|nr:M42 family peptidase [Anaerolineae bacterium]